MYALLPACLLALAAGLLAGGPAGGAVRLPRAAAAGNGALTSLTVTSVGPDGMAADAPSTQTAVAEGGRYVAFQSRAVLGAGGAAPAAKSFALNGSAADSRIYVRNLLAGQTTLISDPADGNATAPSISANGRLVSYEQAGNVYVAGRPASGGYTIRRVTGTANDLAYEHVVPCPAGLGAGRVTPCGPRLSADGSTLVYPAELTPVSPDLSATATDLTASALTASPAAPGRLPGDMLDFAPYSSTSYGNPGCACGAVEIVSYKNTGAMPIAFGSPAVTVTEPPGNLSVAPFTLSGNTCAGRLAPGQSCSVQATFSYTTCGSDYLDELRLVGADLVTHAATPAGQSRLGLTDFCDYYTSSGPAVGRQPACPPPPKGLALAAAPATTLDNQQAPLIDAGAVESGRPHVVWTRLAAPSGAGNVRVLFLNANDSDCGIRLVNPAKLKLADPPPLGTTPACHQGEHLAAASSAAATGPPAACTAYLLIDPGKVSPYSAFLGTTRPPSPSPGGFSPGFSPDVFPATYVTAQGVRHVIVARHDASLAGSKFAASPSTVVSVTDRGAVLPGATEPSVSANGRYVGFAAPVPIGAAGQQPAAGASEVWLRDTGEAAGHRHKPGVTRWVSCLPRAKAGRCVAAPNADSPSVSGDGQQVAFATTAAVVPHNGFRHIVTAAAAHPGVSPDQVYVRSVATRVTGLVSARLSRPNNDSGGQHGHGATPSGQHPPAGGNAPSYAPVITQNSAVVGYVSRATDLTGTPVAAGAANLYLRRSPGSGASELVSASGGSLPAHTAVGLPSVDAVGRLATFAASSVSSAGAPRGIASVYTFDRLPQLTPRPGTAAFGTMLVDSGIRTAAVTVADSGPGPGTVTGVRATGPFGVSGDRCTGVTLYQGSRCVVTLAFRPASTGRAAGMLTVTTQNDGEPPVIASVPASAAVPEPRLATSPGVASSGETTQVTGTWFPPDRKVTLTWRPGLGSAVAATSHSGRFSTYLVIFPGDITGQRKLIATGAGGIQVTAPFIVQPTPAEPPVTSNQPPG